jgi:hypothetical protein
VRGGSGDGPGGVGGEGEGVDTGVVVDAVAVAVRVISVLDVVDETVETILIITGSILNTAST